MISISSDGPKNIIEFNPGYSVLLNYPCEGNNKCYPYKVILKKGKYIIKCWGASGTELDNEYVRGAFTSGILTLKKTKELFFYLGQVGTLNGAETYNGGGHGSQYGNSGGGATDVRLVSGKFDSFNGLLSRIMVAAGAGGFNQYVINTAVYGPKCGNGHGGSLVGDCSYTLINGNSFYNITFAYGGNQTHGGLSGYCAVGECMYDTPEKYYGEFGKGDSTREKLYGCGGGGGYFGGGTSGTNHLIVNSGAGGSSYVSGCDGCSAVSPTSTNTNNISFLNGNVHYSRIKFTDIVMKSGYEEISEPLGELKNGHTGNGAAFISYIGPSFECTYEYTIKVKLIYVDCLIMVKI